MITIHKFPLRVDDSVTVTMPNRAVLLDCQVQNGVPCLWAKVDTIDAKVQRTFRVIGTGHPIDDYESLRYFRTIQMHGGSPVFHVFEVT
jgi:hypothetical protein